MKTYKEVIEQINAAFEMINQSKENEKRLDYESES